MGKFMFNNCSKKTKTALQIFCDSVNNCEGDIFIVMAQKALCLYNLLVTAGLIQKKNVFSSTSIDFNKGMLDWSDKKVVILEDIIVSGSALSAVSNRLMNFGVKTSNLKILAIARDVEYQTMQFTDEDSDENILFCGMNCSDADCIELSYDISRLLSYYGVPYDTDYPSYIETQVDSISYKKLFHSPLWNTYDVSNVENKKNQIISLTLFPTEMLKFKLWNLLDINLNRNIHLKYRVYFNKNNNKLTIVPMALFNEINDNDLLSLYEYLKTKFFPCFSGDKNWTTKTTFRFVQYYIAHKIAILFYEELFNKKELQLKKDWLWNQFGPISNDIYEIINQKNNLNHIQTNNQFAVIEPDTFLFEIKNDTDAFTDNYSQIEINELLLSPFKERHFKAEIPTREMIKQLNAHFTKDYNKIEKYSNRLRKGFSLNALVNIFYNTMPSYDCEEMISLFLDRAIDFGIIVPITYHNYAKGYICRAYRHGEDLPFGESDKYRVVYFLRCLKDYFWLYKVNCNTATITLEKMIVLFFQMGLNHGEVFNRFLGFENYPVLKERFCIHGAIATFFEDLNNDYADHVYTEMETSTWITTWLKKEKLITKKRDREGYHYILNDSKINTYLNKNDCGNLSNDIKIIIESIADIISCWYSVYQNKNKEFKSDITALTSCYNKYTFTSAIITEVHFFKRYWENQVRKNFNIINLDCWDNNTNTFFYNDIEQGLNSGRDKYNWYIDCRAQEVINKVTLNLKKCRNPNFSLWRKCTNDIDEIPECEIGEDLAEALGYLYFYSACYEWLVKGNLLSFGKKKSFLVENEMASKFFEQFKTFSKKSHRLSTDLFSIFDDISYISTTAERINELDRRMTSILEYSEKLISKIEEDISKNAKSFTVFYESCFIIDVKTQCPINNLLIRLWENLDEDIYKTDLNIIDFGIVGESYHRFGIFYNNRLHTQNFNNFYLYAVFEKLKTLLTEKSYVTRTIFVPNIPHQVIMMHNTKEHITKYMNDFSGSFLDYITPYFKDDCLHQMILVESDRTIVSDIDSIKNSYEVYEDLGIIEKIVLPESLHAKIFFTYDERKKLRKCDYSTVRVGSASDEKYGSLGTGFLVKYENDIFCITCQHLFESCNLGKTHIKMKNSNLTFEADFLNQHNEATGQDYLASNDILILKLEHNALYKIDRDKIFSCDDFITDTEAEQTSFSIFGYSNSTGSILESIKFMGLGDNDYYLLSTEKDKVKGGFSGACLVSENGKLLGMHSSHKDKTLFVIPIEQIIQEIKNIKYL